ncbi:hypothetical protein [Bizionia sp. M204]|uniref:hypothetical protein n=1 Tax=Bizionia sp. M204 TaxID=2675331 RepID=UPI00204EA6AC|nr:hypothetical protein [Bizionia sp. M204]UPS92052.1 hypothetical protein GMA17_10115 [Bizionia sp. M204]
MSTNNQGNDTFNLGSEPPINENFVQNKIKLETSLLENKYFRWIISIGVAFIFLKVIDTAAELKYIQGQQSAFDKTINTLFDTRDSQLEDLQKEKTELEKKLLDLDKTKLENEKLKFDKLKLEEQIKKNK